MARDNTKNIKIKHPTMASLFLEKLSSNLFLYNAMNCGIEWKINTPRLKSDIDEIKASMVIAKRAGYTPFFNEISHHISVVSPITPPILTIHDIRALSGQGNIVRGESPIWLMPNTVFETVANITITINKAQTFILIVGYHSG